MKVVEDRPMLSVTAMQSKESNFEQYRPMTNGDNDNNNNNNK